MHFVTKNPTLARAVWKSGSRKSAAAEPAD